MTYLQLQIVRLMLYNPEGIRTFLANTKNPKYVLRYMKSLIPYRTGVEIDLMGSDVVIQKRAEGREVTHSHKREVKYEWEGSARPSIDDCVEVKFSWTHYKRLIQVKKYLDELKQDSRTYVYTDGGLHIHIDMGIAHPQSDWSKRQPITDVILPWYNYIRTKVFGLAKVKEVSRPVDYRVSTEGAGGTDIAIMRKHPTIEYRMGKPTLEYSVIIRQVLCLQQMNKAIRLKKPFNKKLVDDILKA